MDVTHALCCFPTTAARNTYEIITSSSHCRLRKCLTRCVSRGLRKLTLLLRSCLSSKKKKACRIGSDLMPLVALQMAMLATITPISRPALRYDSTSSDATFDQISTWLWSCINTHSKCKVDESRRVLPNRLIAVQGDKDFVRLRLCTTTDLDHNVRYLTLSHCWGKLHFPKLCKESVEQFGQQIRIQELPKTFIDAAHITYCLGYRYTWIDSLCIIQDSDED